MPSSSGRNSVSGRGGCSRDSNRNESERSRGPRSRWHCRKDHVMESRWHGPVVKIMSCHRQKSTSLQQMKTKQQHFGMFNMLLIGGVLERLQPSKDHQHAGTPMWTRLATNGEPLHGVVHLVQVLGEISRGKGTPQT